MISEGTMLSSPFFVLPEKKDHRFIFFPFFGGWEVGGISKVCKMRYTVKYTIHPYLNISLRGWVGVCVGGGGFNVVKSTPDHVNQLEAPTKPNHFVPMHNSTNWISIGESQSVCVNAINDLALNPLHLLR